MRVMIALENRFYEGPSGAILNIRKSILNVSNMLTMLHKN
jgi:hypothetical protein